MSKLQTAQNFVRICTFMVAAMIFTIVLSACTVNNKSTDNAEFRELEAEVMAIHDEVMPKLSNVNALLKQLVEVEEDGTLDSMGVAKVSYHKSALIEADSLMWAWMYAYQPPNRNDDPESIRAHLLSEKEKVVVVRDKILSSISNAQHILQTFSPDEK